LKVLAIRQEAIVLIDWKPRFALRQLLQSSSFFVIGCLSLFGVPASITCISMCLHFSGTAFLAQEVGHFNHVLAVKAPPRKPRSKA
jgi:hypothetical protein